MSDPDAYQPLTLINDFRVCSSQLCPNIKNRIQLQCQYIILGWKFVKIHFVTPGGHLRCVEKYKQNCESLCLGSITMCMPNFVKIRRVISKRRTEMWFVGSNFVDSWHFNKKPQFLTLRKNRKINPRLVSRHKKHVHANFCRNSRSGIQDITHAQLGSYIYSFSVGA